MRSRKNSIRGDACARAVNVRHGQAVAEPDGPRRGLAASGGGSRVPRVGTGWMFACLASLACAGSPLAADLDPQTVTLKSGRTYRVYGDVLVPVDAPPGLEGALSGTRWPAGTLNFAFHGSVSTSQRADFRQWADAWQAGSGIRLREHPTAALRVLVQIQDSIGCGHSAVGMIGGVQDLVIDPDCWTARVVLHELGHALGLVHEHQRADRNTFVSITDQGIVANCGQATWDANYGIVTTHTASAYDYASIMHYPSQAHYVCNGVDVHADITALRAQPDGPPAGSQQACTSAAACQATIGSNTLSDRDHYGMALGYGYSIDVSIVGNGNGTTSVSGHRESCQRPGCYLVTPTSVFTVTATPHADSIVSFSGSCSGQTCQIRPTENGAVQVRYTKKAAIAAIVSVVSMPGPETIFSNGFEIQ